MKQHIERIKHHTQALLALVIIIATAVSAPLINALLPIEDS